MVSKEWSKEQQQAFHKIWAKVIAKAWSDPGFKKRLLNDPTVVLRENGLELPPGAQFKINENTDKMYYLTLPQKPSGELTEESLLKIAAGEGTSTSSR
jgi:hypothetical protein